jgi:hypothetical protein
MSFIIGTVTEFDDPIAVHDPDVLAAAKAVRLGAQKGVFWNMMRSPLAAITQKTFEIYGRNFTSQVGTVGNGTTGWDGSAVTGLLMNAAAAGVLKVGSVVKVESEVVVVKSVNRTANTIDVWKRGHGGTSPAAHANGAAFAVIGHAGNDTDLKNVESFAEATHKYVNYCQTIFETLDYTKMEQLLGRRGLSAQQVMILKEEAMNRVAFMLPIVAINGVKEAGAAAVPSTTAGLLAQLSDTSGGTRPVLRYNANGAAFTEDMLKAALEDVFEVGNPDTILCCQKYKNIMNGFNQAFINTQRADRTAGYNIRQYEFEGRVLDVVVDVDMPVGRVEIVTKAQCQKGWLEGDLLRYVTEPPQSSRELRDSLQGTLGIIIDGVGYDHIDIYGLE